MCQEKWKNAYLTVKKARASRAFKMRPGALPVRGSLC